MMRRWSDPSGRRTLTASSHVLACLHPPFPGRSARGGQEVGESSQSWARAAGDDLAAPPPARAAAPAPMPPGRGSDEGREDAPGGRPPVAPPTDLAEHRRRLLVAGLTRVPREP